MKSFIKNGFSKTMLFAVIFVGIVLSSCVKEKNFPSTPHIGFKAFIKYGLDSADCIVTFTDGDGDIGVASNDTVPDFKMKYLYRGIDGLFHPYDRTPTTPRFDTLFYTYRVPDIMPEGQYKGLDGEIKAKLRNPPIYGPGHTAVKFEISLRDRANHISNIITTEEITVP